MASCMAVQDHDIYLAGKELQGAFMQGHPVARYWKDGSEITVRDSSHSGWTNSVFLAENCHCGKKKRSFTYQNIDDEQPDESRSSGDIFSSIFKFIKKSPGQSSTTNRKVAIPTVIADPRMQINRNKASQYQAVNSSAVKRSKFFLIRLLE